MVYIIFVKPKCGFSSKAKKLLTNKKKQFVVITCKNRDELIEQLRKHKLRVPNTLTFPRIYYDKKLIGGFDDLIKKLK